MPPNLNLPPPLVPEKSSTIPKNFRQWISFLPRFFCNLILIFGKFTAKIDFVPILVMVIPKTPTTAAVLWRIRHHVQIFRKFQTHLLIDRGRTSKILANFEILPNFKTFDDELWNFRRTFQRSGPIPPVKRTHHNRSHGAENTTQHAPTRVGTSFQTDTLTPYPSQEWGRWRTFDGADERDIIGERTRSVANKKKIEIVIRLWAGVPEGGWRINWRK